MAKSKQSIRQLGDNPVIPKPKRGRVSNAEKLERQGQTTMFNHLISSPAARNNLKQILAASKIDDSWRGMLATPPGSMLEDVIQAFKEGTDIPLEIPFFTTMHYISQFLLKSNVSINFKNNRINCDLWNIILAQSGSSKTYASKTIRQAMGEEDGFSTPSSAAKYIEMLEHRNNTGWVEDEFGKFLKLLELPHMIELKNYLLKTYDGDRLERNTLKREIHIEKPTLSILGLTVLDTFVDELPPGAMIDGFAQRFGYIIAKPDPNRAPPDFVVYSLSGHYERISKKWENIKSTIENGSEYVVTQEAEEAYIQSFKNLYRDASGVLDTSFFRRILWRSTRYALIYHILLGKTSREIDIYDMGWAARITQMHLKDVADLITTFAMPELAKLMERCIEVREKIRIEQGRDVLPRDIVINVKKIKNVHEARALIDLIS